MWGLHAAVVQAKTPAILLGAWAASTALATSGRPSALCTPRQSKLGLHDLLLTSLRSLKVGTLRGALDTG